MLDWKILAASLVALLFISSVFIGGFGIRDFLTGIVGKIRDYLGTSPFDNILPSPDGKKQDSENGGREITIMLHPKELALEPSPGFSVSSGETVIESFAGEIQFNFIESSVRLSNHPLSITLPLNGLEASSISFDSLTLENMKFEIQPDISTDSGSMVITGFFGNVTSSSKGLELSGTVEKLKVTIGELDFELV